MASIMRLLDINHSDRFDYLVSMSTKSVSLARYAALKYGDDTPFAQRKYAQGDVNVTLLHTAGGKIVHAQFRHGHASPARVFPPPRYERCLHARRQLGSPRRLGAGSRRTTRRVCCPCRRQFRIERRRDLR